MDSNQENIEKVKIYINIEPLGLKFGTVFKKTETFQSVINFVLSQIKKLNINFELGRINEDKTGAILLTDNLIGDFLENNDEITVYSEEYGFIRNNFPGGNERNSSKKIYFLKNVSNLYKSKNFLKKKRNEKQKNEKKEGKNEEKSDEKDEREKKPNSREVEKEKNKSNIDIREINTNKKEKNKKENEKDNKNEKNKDNKKDKKNVEKENNKNLVKSFEKKLKKKEASSSDSDDEEKNE